MTRSLCFIVIMILAPAGLAAEGTVRTPEGVAAGRIEFTETGISCNDAAIGWENLASVSLVGDAGFFPAPEALRLKDGEIWRGRILEAAGGKVKFRACLLGEIEAKLDEVASLDFVSGLDAGDDEKEGRLYRREGRELPGKLLWIDATRAAVDSPLGVITLDKEKLLRYRLAAAGAPGAEADRVLLRDGSLLLGKAKPALGGIALAGGVGGDRTVPAETIRQLWLARPGLLRLALLRPEREEFAPVVGAAEKRAANATADAPTLRLEPVSTVSYKIGAGRQVFSCLLQPVAGARGDATLTVKSGGKEILRKTVKAGGAAEFVSAAFDGAGGLSFETDLAGACLFPLGVKIVEPLVCPAPATGAAKKTDGGNNNNQAPGGGATKSAAAGDGSKAAGGK